MKEVLLIILSIIPAIILLIYFDKQDKGEREPMKLKWRVFWWGVIATFFAAVIELTMMTGFDYFEFTQKSQPVLYAFVSAFIVAALVEEGLKLWVVKTQVYNEKKFNEVMDGITYAIIASLGFATLENIMYVLSGGLTLAFIRALISVPAHALFSGIMGYYIGLSRFAPTPKKRLLLLKGLLIGIFYHGLFNFILLAESTLTVLIVPLMLVMWLHLSRLITLVQSDHGKTI